MILSVKAGPTHEWEHDPSVAIFDGGELVYGCEEERFTRVKHAHGTFPERSLRNGLDEFGIAIDDIKKVIIPTSPHLQTKGALSKFRNVVARNQSVARMAYDSLLTAQSMAKMRFGIVDIVRRQLQSISETGMVPPIETYGHHRCHAASAFYPTSFDEALVLTVDGRGEYDSTVVWEGTRDGLTRAKTFKHRNSLGTFFASITEFLGYRANNGEGKIMGLAPYGSENTEINATLREQITTGSDYDFTPITLGGTQTAVSRLEELFGRKRRSKPGEFDQWEKDLAFVAQQILEETVLELVEKYCNELGKSNVGLAGGVALNCKMNKRVMESDIVENIFIQPVAHDAGITVGAGMLEYAPYDIPEMNMNYWGPEYSQTEIAETLNEIKVQYTEPENLERYVAEAIADQRLVGWFQGRLEMGPRALGNRSILADPRSVASRDRVNEFVKHREKWRPFAPTMLEEAADEYLVNAEPSPYMIKTFDTHPETRDEIEAVLHPGDNTTRPQTVAESQNPRYYRLIREFENITGVPVLLNTSFNDHGEPIVTTPTEAIKDFFGMGLDVLVLGDFVLKKGTVKS